MFSLICHIFVFALSVLPAMADASALPPSFRRKPTVVIVPGSWQLPNAWDEFRAILARASYQSYHVSLPSVGGTDLPLTGLSEDVDAVQHVIRGFANHGDEIILLCHSSGGIVGSNAVQGFDVATRQALGKKGGVIRIVYLSAFMLPKNQSLLGMLGGVPLPWMVVNGDRVTGDPTMMPEIGFNDLPADEKTFWAGQTTWTSAALFAATSQFEPWKKGIPGAYIFQTADNALPLNLQQGMAQQLQLGPDPRTATLLNSGHCGFLSMPLRLLIALKQVTE